MLKERFKTKVGVFLVLLQDDKVLLSRRFNTGIADGLHVVPIGGLEDKETLIAAIIREAYEEIGIVLEPSFLQVAHVMYRQHVLPQGTAFSQIDVFFIPEQYKGTVQNQEPHKCDELAFYPLHALPKTIEPFIQQALSCIQKRQIFSEFGWVNHKETPLQDEIENTPKTDLTANIYDTEAPIYDDFRKADPALVQQLGRFFKQNKESRYLDIGCGSGNYTIALSQRGVQIEGVDLADSMLKRAKTKAPHLSWGKADMRALPFATNTFDGILTVNTLHYVRNYLPITFLEMARVVKPGGKIVIFAVVLEQCLQFWLGHYFPFFQEVGHQALPKKEELIKALGEASLVDLEIEPFFVTENTLDLFNYACKYRPHLYLEEKVRLSMTPFQLPEYEKEIKLGCEHLQRDLASGAIYRVIAQHESPLGEGLIICAKKS